MEHLNSNILNVTTLPLFFCLGVMVLAYFWALKINFYSLVDAFWAYLFIPVAFYYSSLPSNFIQRNWTLLFLVTVWGMRLGTYLLIRLKAHYPKEDSRYLELRAKWSRHLKFNFFIFFLFQGLSVVILSLPFLLIALNPRPEFHPVEILGIIVWICGILCEVLADGQLRRFILNANNDGKICNIGLWKYSRHPNYFGEWMIWLGYFLFAVTAPNGWLAIASPAIMLYLLVKVTGVPFAEASSLKSKGDLYREYQRTTSRFIPWLPKK